MTEPSEVWASPPERASAAEWGHFPRPPRPVRSTGERAVALTAWTACGLAFAASLMLFPIGLLVLPLPVAVAAGLASRGSQWPEILGLGPGIAAFFSYVAYRNRHDYPACENDATVVLTTGQTYRCGGMDPEPWLTAAMLVVAVSAIAYTLALLAEYQRRK